MTPDEWLCRLLDATTLPPKTDDVATLIDAFQAMVRDRQALFDDPVRPTSLGAHHAEIVAEIDIRQAEWRRALAEARTRVSAHRAAANQCRRYQRAA